MLANPDRVVIIRTSQEWSWQKRKETQMLSEYYKKQMKLKSSKVKVGMKVKCIHGEHVNRIGTCVGLTDKEIRVSMYGLRPMVSSYSSEIILLPTEILDNRLNWFQKPEQHSI